MLKVCLHMPSRLGHVSSHKVPPWLSCLKLAFFFFPFVCLIPLFSLVSGLHSRVTYTLAFAFENTQPQYPPLYFFLFLSLKVCPTPMPTPGKTIKARSRLAWKGHFHILLFFFFSFYTVSSGKSHGSPRESLSFSMTFPDLASLK